jgi:DNA polymerase
MAHAELDFETYSEAGYRWVEALNKWRAPDGTPENKKGLKGVGAPVYAAHPSTEVLCLAYDLQDGRGKRLWHPGKLPPLDLFQYITAGGLIEAHNSSFEFYIWHYVCAGRMGWPALPLAQLRCSMSKANAWGLPGALGKLAEILEAPEQKDKAGGALITKLCCPRNPTKKDTRRRLTPADSPLAFDDLYDYCEQDIKAEAAVSAMLPDLKPDELELWLLDQHINVRGVYIDPEGLSNCVEIVRQAREQYTAELKALVNIPDITIDKLEQLKGWMAARGFVTASLDADHVAAALKRTDLPPDVYRVIQLRDTLGSASVKKTAAIARTVSSDERLRDLFVFNGARQTGRWAGMGAQPQNLPNSGPAVCKCSSCDTIRWAGLPLCLNCYSSESVEAEWGIEAVEVALEAIASRDLATVEALWGDATATVAGCLRGLFSAAPGHDLICSDYSAIEAVVLAELAGETWRQEVFRTHGKIYEASAAKIIGVPFEEFMAHAGYTDLDKPEWWLEPQTGPHHPMRKKIGKVAELASGFGGWINAWKQFGADKYFKSDEDIKNAIIPWRNESPMIVEFWGGQWRKDPNRWAFTPELYGLEGAAVMAIQTPGQCYEYRGIVYGVRDDVLYCRLLSGRTLAYHKPRLHAALSPFGRPIQAITFMGWNSDGTKGPIGWMRRETYGGKLCENVVQATANDIMRHVMPPLERAGYPIVLHVHDEIISEVPKGRGSIEEFEKIMATLPGWCAHWPIKAAGGWRGRRYRKD